MKIKLVTRIPMVAAILLLPLVGYEYSVSAQDSNTQQSKATDDRAEKLFSLKVMPILKDKCLGCHGGDSKDIKGEFSVLTRADLLRGGESEEPSIVPHKPDQGTLLSAIRWDDLEMPPKENDRLTPQQISLFEEWIRQGAPWPNEQKQKQYRDQEAKKLVTDEGRIVPTSGGTSSEWTNRRYQEEDLWAFMPLKRLSELLPKNVSRDHAIDFLINEKLNGVGISPAESAKPRDLIRRATFDLTGLSPTPQEVKSFLTQYEKDAQSAWSKLIDRLLDSPRYGEHWGRHWLDVTRYADTGGMSNDFERSNMWRYRDYVIRSFNSDKPYDQFIVEQLAGDELADQSVLKRNKNLQKFVSQAQLKGKYNSQEAEWIVATGFLRMGPWDNAMIEADEARQIYLDDLVNITGQTFLSQTMRCCKCHDHKFDPLPTRDYYRLYSAFSTTQMAERPVPFLPSENLEGLKDGKAHVQRMLKFATAEKNKILEKQESAARMWYQENGLPYKKESARRNDPDEKKPPRHVGLNYIEQGQRKVREQDEWIWTRRLERYQPMAQSVYNSSKFQLAWNGARKLRINRVEKKEKDVKNHILTGGALSALGDQVFPGVLSAISLSADSGNVSQKSKDPYRLPASVDGRRLGLAKWIANPKNQLTTRSIANRIWQYHFGKGISANSNNFGAKGAKPTHPKLLDFLAHDFVQEGWSIKKMHRLIMMSDAYRRSTVPNQQEKLGRLDPNNGLLSFFPRRRLTAEELRDSILLTTGELVQTSGGLPIMPEINMEVALQPRMIQFSLAPAYQPSPTPQQRNRRSIFAYHVRGQADPFTELFNQPNPNESCELRETAAVTPQVFAMLNSDMLTDRSIALAKRLESENEALKSQIQSAFQLVLLRDPTQQEVFRMTKYVQEMTAYHQDSNPTPPEYPKSIQRSLVEEFSGRTFEYKEILPVFEAYQSDTKASDVSASTRALADFCLILFNTNEFMYVQ